MPVYAPEPVASDGVEFVAISVGGRHACALADDGSAWCWGNNDIIGGGQLGDGTATARRRRARGRCPSPAGTGSMS